MAMSFNESAGGAKKNNLEYMKFNLGTNTMRIVGDIIPRYAYWKQLGTNSIPVECLAFNRDEERFLNLEKDWFKHYFPTIQGGKDDGKDNYPVWSYVGRAIDPKDGKLKMVGFKKKLFEQIQSHANKHLGDPTNEVTGWDVVFDKNSTGNHAFNIEYVLDQMSCKTRALSAEELELIKDMKPIEELVPRPTADQQKQFIENAWFGDNESNSDADAAQAVVDTSEEDKIVIATVAAVEELYDDIPF